MRSSWRVRDHATRGAALLLDRLLVAEPGHVVGVDGARITLTDEADGGRLLKSWPEEDH
ncbi:hypothetical protein ABZV67_40960 [Streptomyces sp. NPDC005065]|uniref:hypothetical protein n=1 Tax=Streptomyces sp. NPDC005065 TaxID=3154461 RepID=UPI0033B58992